MPSLKSLSRLTSAPKAKTRIDLGWRSSTNDLDATPFSRVFPSDPLFKVNALVTDFGATAGRADGEVDQDRLPYDLLVNLRKIAGGELGWGRTLPGLTEAQWREFGRLALGFEVTGLRVEETTNRASGYPVWQIWGWRV